VGVDHGSLEEGLPPLEGGGIVSEEEHERDFGGRGLPGSEFFLKIKKEKGNYFKKIKGK
jgi:hypothetical protein